MGSNVWRNVSSFEKMNFKACCMLASHSCFDSRPLEISTQSVRRVLFKKKTRLAFRANEAHLRLLKEIAKRLQNFLTSFVVRDARFVRDYDAVFHSH